MLVFFYPIFVSGTRIVVFVTAVQSITAIIYGSKYRIMKSAVQKQFGNWNNNLVNQESTLGTGKR
jgi:hypothetical protein